jgi:DNA-binding transcriptional LysR family regulator
MNPTQLQTFRTAAATLSFTRTAELLDYAQSSVSAQIRGLEGELGAPLFNRLGRRVALTEAGQRLLAYSERLLALEAEVRTGVSQAPGAGGMPTAGPLAPTVLRLGAPESVMTHWLPARLARFKAEWPGVRLDYAPLPDRELYGRVLDGRLDFALLLQPPVRVAALQARRLSAQPLRVIAAAGHPLAGRRRVGPRDLAGETVFLTESGCGYRHLFEQELSKQGLHAVTRLEFDSVAAIKHCVAAGLGVGFLPQLAVQDLLDARALAALRWEKTFTADLQLVWPKAKWLSPLEARWVAMCEAE